ncbi:Protein RD3, partial [Lamellibrachia satsuma]
IGSWLKSWKPSSGKPPERNPTIVVMESLLMELDYEVEQADLARIENERRSREQTMGVDYSWLVIKSPKPYSISQLERLELEELCMKVKPQESTVIIRMFRDALVREPPVEDIPKIFRAVIIQLLEGRPTEETIPEWVKKNLTRLRPASRIMP